MRRRRMVPWRRVQNPDLNPASLSHTRPSGLRAPEISVALDGMAGFHLCAGQIGSVCPALQNRTPIVIGLDPSAADIPRGNQAAKMIAAGNRIAGCATTTRPTGTRHFRSVDTVQPSAADLLAPDIVAVVDIGSRAGEGARIIRRGSGRCAVPEEDRAKDASRHNCGDSAECLAAQVRARDRRALISPFPAHQSIRSRVSVASKAGRRIRGALAASVKVS